MPILNHQAADRAIQKKTGLQRSSAWPKVEKAFRAGHPKCAVCGRTAQLNVHHKFPFHYVVICGRPDLELDARNLITLCVQRGRQHHILLGHLDDYESYNPGVSAFVKTYAGQTGAKIRRNASWRKAHAAKPKHVDQMTPVEMDAFRKKLDRKFPPKPSIVVEAVEGRAMLKPEKKFYALLERYSEPR